MIAHVSTAMRLPRGVSTHHICYLCVVRQGKPWLHVTVRGLTGCEIDNVFGL